MKIMKELIKELSPKLKYIKSEIKDDIRYIYAEPLEEEGVCPYCGSVSLKVHSHYGIRKIIHTYLMMQNHDIL